MVNFLKGVRHPLSSKQSDNLVCSGMHCNTHKHFNPLAAKLFNRDFHSLEVASRLRDPQLQVSENYSDLSAVSNIAD